MWKFAVVGLAATIFAGSAIAEAPVKKSDPKSIEELDKALGATFAAAKIQGVNVAIVEGGKIVLAKGYGFADVKAKIPVTPETVFRAGSISKSLTSIGIMILVEEGKLRLEDKLSDLVPELKFLNPWEATDPIRLVHLLEHTSGFDDIRFRHYLLEGKDVPLSKAVEAYGPYESRWKPGTRTSYSNSAPVIAGRIIEKVSGLSFPEFMEQRLTGPLGMTSAHWTKVPEIAGRLSKSYKNVQGDEEPFVEILARPSGSLNVTPTDLVRIIMLMNGRGTLDGKTYFTPETAARIETPMTNDGAKAGLKFGYGLGNMAYPGKRAIFHGHDGGIDGFVSKYEYAPSLNAGFVVMANRADPEAFTAAETIRAYLERDAPPVVVAPVALAADAAALTGYYRTIAPRQQNLAMLSSLGPFQYAEVKDGALWFNGTKRIHLGNMVFQKEDRAAPNIVFVKEPQGLVMYTPTDADIQVPLWELAAKAGYGAMLVVSIVASLIYALVWLPSAFMGRLSERGGVAVRAIPFLALGSLIVFALMVQLGLGSADLQTLGRPSLQAWTIYGATLAAPVLGGLALLTALMASRDVNWFARTLAWTSALSALIAGAYFQQYGWLGMKIWE